MRGHGADRQQAAQQRPTSRAASTRTLGSPKLHLARESAAVAVKAEADRHAANVLPIIKEAQKLGRTRCALWLTP
jgi:hypothetical protein